LISTEIHIPISLNSRFINMTRMFVQSAASNAGFTGPWKIVVTVSRDTQMTLDAPELAWARDYPVEFRWVEAALWEKHGLLGTVVQRHSYEVGSDVVLFMDADIVVCGSLDELVTEIAAADVVAGWPAWQPPDGNLDEILASRGCTLRSDYGVTYSGFGLEFLTPSSAPPYFNLGLIAVSRRQADRLRRAYPEDLYWVYAHHPHWFGCQTALCMTIMRQSLPYRVLDMRYNLSNGDWDEVPEITGEAVDRAVANVRACVADPRVLHYCVPTPAFSKARDMESLDRIREFCARDRVGAGNLILQRVLRELV
jgi:hypothetical protein